MCIATVFPPTCATNKTRLFIKYVTPQNICHCQSQLANQDIVHVHLHTRSKARTNKGNGTLFQPPTKLLHTSHERTVAHKQSKSPPTNARTSLRATTQHNNAASLLYDVGKTTPRQMRNPRRALDMVSPVIFQKTHVQAERTMDDPNLHLKQWRLNGLKKRFKARHGKQLTQLCQRQKKIRMRGFARLRSAGRVHCRPEPQLRRPPTCEEAREEKPSTQHRETIKQEATTLS